MESLQHAVTKWEASLPANDDKTLIAISRAPRAEAGAPRTGDGRRSRAGALWNRREGSDHLSITASLSAVDAVGPWLRQCESLRDWNTEGIALIEQGLYEVLCNIAEHGCALDESKTIDIWWIVDRQSSHADRGAFLVRDRGRPPVPESWAPRDGLRERRRKGRGYGLELIDKTISVPEFCPETPVGNLTVVRIGPGET
jgi:anti-sigma regulatory factor (Ser/Thr protein kinase)